MFTEISVNDINDFRLGHASNKEAGTGVTVIYFPDGATAGAVTLAVAVRHQEKHLLLCL